MNWDSGIFTFKSNSFHATDYKMVNSSGTRVEYSSQTNPATLNQGGLGYYADLCSLELVQSAQKGTAYFTLLPKQSIYRGDDYVASICAEYVHDKNPYSIVGSISFSWSGVGVSINLDLLKDSVTAAKNYRYTL